jgi:hypothetical protein
MVELREKVVEEAEQTSALENALLVARAISELPFELNLWQAQNLWYDVYRRLYGTLTQNTGPSKKETASAEARGTGAWQERFREVGQLLGISVDELVIEDEAPQPGV